MTEKGETNDRSTQRSSRREDFGHVLTIPTRWMDNDVYGHVNNVVYYSFFDTVINRYLIDEGGLDLEHASVIGLAVESACSYHRPVAFPSTIEAALRVGKLGTSSVRYEVGIFVAGEPEIAAIGHFVHVFVDRATRRPTPIPQAMRDALGKLVRAA
jgi:acyl-CoA thioester hydrolase